MERVIFTDLDGTLLDKNNYSFSEASFALKKIKEKKIPLVICTSKTRKEIEVYQKKLNNDHPFISEDGGAIFIPKKYFKKKFKYNKSDKKYFIIELGIHYQKLKKIIKEIEINTKVKIIAFSNMSAKDLAKDSGLPLKEAKLAIKREYDEPFKMIGKNQNKVLNAIKSRGLNYVEGGRYFHLVGNNDKAKAVEILKQLYENELGKKVQTIGLGDSDNDKKMLEKVDIGFLIKRKNKSYPKVKNTKVKKITKIADAGWNEAINELLFEFDAEGAEELYHKSIDILKELQLFNGAIFASRPSGRYPYVYPRDFAICILGLISAGLYDEAKLSLEFAFLSQSNDGSFPQRMKKSGKDASYKPIQLDNTGLILYAFAKYIEETKDKYFEKAYSSKVKKSIKYIESKINKDKYLLFTPNSIHEFPPYEEGLDVWANAVCIGALKELKKIKYTTKLDLNKMKKSIEKYLWNKDHFIKNIRLDESSSVATEVDACSYALADYGVIDDKNSKIKSNVKKIENELWDEKIGGLCRYPKHIGRNNGGWGPWPHFTLMIARHFIRTGQKKKAQKYIQWVLDTSYFGEIPEHVATKKNFEEWLNNYKSSGILRKDRQIMAKNILKSKSYKERKLAFSVLPLAWPHAEFIRTWNLYKKKFLS